MIIVISFASSFEQKKFCSELENILQTGDDAIQNESNNRFFDKYSLLREPEQLEDIYVRFCVPPTQQPTLSVNRDKIMSILGKIQDDIVYLTQYLFYRNHTEYPSLRQTQSTSDNWIYVK